MSDAVGRGDLVLCVNVAPNHATGRPVPLVAGETYRVIAVMEFACPCGRSDALLDVGAESGATRTVFPAQGGQQSGDGGQRVRAG